MKYKNSSHPSDYSRPISSINHNLGEPSSNFEKFLAARSQFDSDHGVDFSALTCCLSAISVRPFFLFYFPLFFTKTNNK